MPFSNEDTWKILTYLELDYSQASLVEAKLRIVEQQSETLVQHTLGIVSQLDSVAEEMAEAVTGLIKADVLEWKENRKCDLQSYRCYLKMTLARAIGFPIKTPMPFSD